MKKRKGQVWVETVIYTLIALVLIGTVLAFVKPKIEQIQDKSIIDQTVEILGYLDSRIVSVMSGPAGNQRTDDIKIKKGSMKIDGENDEIVFEIESRHKYSEPGESIDSGNIIILTEEDGKDYVVSLKLDYSEKYDVAYEGEDQSKTITKASTDYKISFSNLGKDIILGDTCTVSTMALDCINNPDGYVFREQCVDDGTGVDRCEYISEVGGLNITIL